MIKNELEEGVLAFQAEGKASRSCWGAERRPKGKGNAGGVAIVCAAARLQAAVRLGLVWEACRPC